MGLMNRISTMIKAKMSKVVDAAEDPREMLDYSYEKMLEQLQTVKRGVVDVTAAKKRLEIQREKLVANAATLEAQAREAVGKQRDDLARLALERKSLTDQQVAAMDGEIASIAGEQAKLVAAEKRLETKVAIFRTRKETIKAQYSAARAQVRVGESVAGISEDMADIGITIERAETRTEDMRARSAAIDELIEVGTLTDFTGTEDDIARELAKVGGTTGVDEALAKLKAEAVA